MAILFERNFPYENSWGPNMKLRILPLKEEKKQPLFNAHAHGV